MAAIDLQITYVLSSCSGQQNVEYILRNIQSFYDIAVARICSSLFRAETDTPVNCKTFYLFISFEMD